MEIFKEASIILQSQFLNFFGMPEFNPNLTWIIFSLFCFLKFVVWGFKNKEHGMVSSYGRWNKEDYWFLSMVQALKS